MDYSKQPAKIYSDKLSKPCLMRYLARQIILLKITYRSCFTGILITGWLSNTAFNVSINRGIKHMIYFICQMSLIGLNVNLMRFIPISQILPVLKICSEPHGYTQ